MFSSPKCTLIMSMPPCFETAPYSRHAMPSAPQPLTCYTSPIIDLKRTQIIQRVLSRFTNHSPRERSTENLSRECL